MPTCRANRHPQPSSDLPVGQWILETARHMVNYEPCGKPATHAAYAGSKPLCAEHAEEMRSALRRPNALGNILAGDRVRTEEEIAQIVRELS